MEVRTLLLERTDNEDFRIIKQEPRSVDFIGNNGYKLMSCELPEFDEYSKTLFLQGNQNFRDNNEIYICDSHWKKLKETLIEYNTILENKIKIMEL